MGCYDCGEYDPCNPKDCECIENDCGCDFFISSLSCIRHDGNLLECIGAETGSTLETIIKKIDEKLCSVQSGSNGSSAYEVAVENGFEGTVEEWLESLNGTDADASCCCDLTITFAIASVEADFPVSIQSTVTGGTAPYTYQWQYNGMVGVTDSGVYTNSNLLISNIKPYTALLKLTVTDATGCSNEEYYFINDVIVEDAFV